MIVNHKRGLIKTNENKRNPAKYYPSFQNLASSPFTVTSRELHGVVRSLPFSMIILRGFLFTRLRG